jgi:DNA-binding GntR family transcriptional regulator
VRAVDRAYEELRNRIRSGSLPAGARLREENLAEQLGLSRTPVREALRRLQADGLVEVVAHRGAHVAAWTEHDLDEIFGLRALLEGRAARLAAERVNDAQAAALRATAEELSRVASRARPDLSLIRALNFEFHAGVLAAAASPRLVALLQGLVQGPLVQQTFRRYDPEALRRSAGHHLELVQALESRDGEWAEAVMQAHVRAGLHALRERDERDAASG